MEHTVLPAADVVSGGLCPNIQAAQGAQGDAVVLAVFVVPSGTDHLWGEENTWTVPMTGIRTSRSGQSSTGLEAS